MYTKAIVKLTLAIISIFLFSTLLPAATVVQTVTGPTASLSPSGTFTINKFDPALGTLTSVDIQVSTTTSEIGFIISGTGSNSYVSQSYTTDYVFTGPSATSLSGTINDGGFSFFNIGATSFNYTVPASGQNNSTSDTTALGAWEGSSGTLSFSYSFTNHGTGGTTSGGNAQQVSPATDIGHPFGPASTFTATITYNFTPEPGRVGLIALGLMGLIGRRRRA